MHGEKRSAIAGLPGQIFGGNFNGINRTPPVWQIGFNFQKNNAAFVNLIC
ncbi:MAG: hypothetical protein IK051_04535 [Rhodocyclaceae bacterium]|nr:hypothetical protein [Rhodocyclaceae bacterium]